jgi:hypothetical protein
MGLSKIKLEQPPFMLFLFEFLSFTVSQKICFPIKTGGEDILSSSTLKNITETQSNKENRIYNLK